MSRVWTARAVRTVPRELKYKNRFTTYQGRTYHSALEASHAQELDARIVAGEVRSWIPQYPIELAVNGKPLLTEKGRPMVHLVDFLVTLADGSVRFEEVKGHATKLWLLKRALVEVICPGVPYVVYR